MKKVCMSLSVISALICSTGWADFNIGKVRVNNLEYVFFQKLNPNELQVGATVVSGSIQDQNGIPKAELSTGAKVLLFIPVECGNIANSALSSGLIFAIDGPLSADPVLDMSGQSTIRFQDSNTLDCGLFKQP